MLHPFAHIVDYAGLYPPAACGMDEALLQYAEYLRSADRWMLGRFVIGIERMPELIESLQRLDLRMDLTPAWDLTAVFGPDVRDGLQRLRTKRPGVGVPLRWRAIEARAASVAQIEELEALLPVGLERIVEIPPGEAHRPYLEAMHDRWLIAKLRTGGVTPDLFPTTHQVWSFLEDAVALGVPFKLTAGLHHPFGGMHPLTYEPDSARHRMFGFVNILLATALLRAGTPGEAIEALLEDDDRAAFDHDAAGWSWRGHRVSTADLLETREHGFRGFGSCSFREPVDELALEERPA